MHTVYHSVDCLSTVLKDSTCVLKDSTKKGSKTLDTVCGVVYYLLVGSE